MIMKFEEKNKMNMNFENSVEFLRHSHWRRRSRTAIRRTNRFLTFTNTKLFLYISNTYSLIWILCVHSAAALLPFVVVWLCNGLRVWNRWDRLRFVPNVEKIRNNWSVRRIRMSCVKNLHGNRSTFRRVAHGPMLKLLLNLMIAVVPFEIT